MIVKYVRERGYKGRNKDPHLTLGREYVILNMTIRAEKAVHEITLQSDLDGDPGVWDLNFFDIIDPHVPEDWVFVSLKSPGYHRLTPQEFTGDFWDWYHDGTKEEGEYARRILANVIIKIKRFHDRWDL